MYNFGKFIKIIMVCILNLENVKVFEYVWSEWMYVYRG